VSKVGPLVSEAGGKVLAFGPCSPVEGEAGHPVMGLVEWPDSATAQTWYDSEEYQAIIPLRKDGTTGETTFTLAEGM
jgi:uncharacterized protein (DUF1330 family)